MTSEDFGKPSDLHRALAEVVGYLDGTNADVINPSWVEFDIHDAFVIANIKEGAQIIRLRANLLEGEQNGNASAEDVAAWAAKQPSVVGGILEVTRFDDELDEIYLPRLVFELSIGEFTLMSGIWENHAGEIAKFGKAWRSRSVAEPAPSDGMLLHRYRQGPSMRPFHTGPRSAWLLIGDAASWPDAVERERFTLEGRAGIYNTLWTAPKTIEVGDLVLIYYVAPTKAARFVARAASRAFWRNDILVNADAEVAEEQWWAYLTPLIEIEPIPYSTLKAAEHGHLLLRGRSGHFLQPGTVEGLEFEAKDSAQQGDVERIVQKPQGRADLPPTDEITFHDWGLIAAGALTLETDVSNFVVEPMLRWALEQDAEITRVLDGWEREVKIESGYVDFLLRGLDFHGHSDADPLVAIEVKLAIRQARSGRWLDSPDFRQLRRYMDELNTRGMLVDAQSILLVERGADAPFAELRRADVTQDDLMEMLRYFPIDKHWHGPGWGRV